METPEIKIIQPPLDCREFEINGVVYAQTPTLALSRGRILQRFQTEMLFDVTLPGLVQTVMAANADFNSGKLADGFFKFGHLKEKIDLIGHNEMRAAMIVGLFFNDVTNGEDFTTYDHAAMTAKVYTAWRAVDTEFFKKKAYYLLSTTGNHYPNPPAEEAEGHPTTENPLLPN